MCKAAEQNPAPSVAFQRAGGGAGHLEPVRLGHMKYKDAAGLVGPLLVDASKKVVTSQDERLERTKQLKAPALCPLAKLKTDEPQLGKLVEEAKDAATRRLLDRPEDLEGLLARASELPDTMPLVQEFQDLVGTIHDGLADVLGKLKTRDLLPKEPLFHEATTQSLQLVIDRLKAKASVDTPEELSRCRSVEDSARAEYERYSKQLDEDGGDDEKFCDASEDTLEDEDAPMVDAATMLRCTNDLETALGEKYKHLWEHIEAQERQLEQNTSCNQSLHLPCVDELKQQKEVARGERSKVAQLHQRLKGAKKLQEEEEAKRQKVLKDNMASCAKTREAIERQQAVHKDNIEKEMHAWLDLEANRKMLVELEAFQAEQSTDCANEFQGDDEWIDDTDTKLRELMTDLERLEAAVSAQHSSLDEVKVRADRIVQGYSAALSSTVAQNLHELKQTFDEQYKLVLQRKSNLESQQRDLNTDLKALSRQKRQCSLRLDTDAEQKFVQQMQAAKERLEQVKAELETYSQRLSALDEDWQTFFVRKLPTIQECSPHTVFDERELMKVQAEDRSVTLEEERLKDEDQQRQQARRQLQARRTSITDLAVRIEAERQLLTAPVDAS